MCKTESATDYKIFWKTVEITMFVSVTSGIWRRRKYWLVDLHDGHFDWK